MQTEILLAKYQRIATQAAIAGRRKLADWIELRYLTAAIWPYYGNDDGCDIAIPEYESQLLLRHEDQCHWRAVELLRGTLPNNGIAVRWLSRHRNPETLITDLDGRVIEDEE